MNHQEVMASKHSMQITAHERAYGAKLGELKNPPTKKQLDKDYEDRRARGELFTQRTGQRLKDQKVKKK